MAALVYNRTRGEHDEALGPEGFFPSLALPEVDQTEEEMRRNFERWAVGKRLLAAEVN